MILLLFCSTKPQLAISHFNYFITGTTETETHKAKKIAKNKKEIMCIKRYQATS
jgi:hypothetical protein